MSEFLVAVCGGSVGAAVVTGVMSIIKVSIEHRHKKQDHAQERSEQKEQDENVQNKALRYILLYIIQERASKIIARGWTTFDERRALYDWHKCYHDGLNGNGDADTWMKQVAQVKVVSDLKEVELEHHS